jgi:hypothetical protein
VPSTWPGTRAPHVWLKDGRSTLDLFGRSFTLLDLSGRGHGARGFTAAAKRVGLPLEVVGLEESDVREVYARAFVLVRPDGHVAWRGDELLSDAAAIVDHVRGAADGVSTGVIGEPGSVDSDR